MVYEHEQGRLTKKLPRYQQYRAVTRALERIARGRSPAERGGVVWHTQGSGERQASESAPYGRGRGQYLLIWVARERCEGERETPLLKREARTCLRAR